MARPIKGRNGGTLMALEKGETANRKGRPPKLATTIIKALKEQGVARVSRTEIDDLIGMLQNLPRKKLLEYVKDEANTPIIVALIARGLSGAKGHEFMSRDLWDRAHGKAKQAMEISGDPNAPIQITREIIHRNK